MTDLLPCPFCGHMPAVVLDDERNKAPDPPFWIECENHHCINTCRSEGLWSEYDTIVAAWNRRAPDPRDEVIRQLVEAGQNLRVFVSAFARDDTVMLLAVSEWDAAARKMGLLA